MERLDSVSGDAEGYRGDDQRSNGEEGLPVPCCASLFRPRKESRKGEREVFSDASMHDLEVMAPGAAQSSGEPRVDELTVTRRQEEQPRLARALARWPRYAGQHSAANDQPVGG